MKQKLKLWILGLAVGFVNGLFGSGGGTLLVPALTHLIDEEEKKAHATAIACILPITVVSALVYTNRGYTDWNITLLSAAGAAAGSIIGALLLKKLKPEIIKKIFGVFMVIAAIRMIF